MSPTRAAARPRAPRGRGRLPLSGPIVAPSILSADFANLAAALGVADPAREWVHCDVMDNQFVPNLTFGPLIVGAARRLTRAFLDVHLMIERPETLIARFREAGADQITVHLEACARPAQVLAAIRKSGARAGLAIKPRTPLARAERHLGAIDLLLVMTVEPGFGGQAFMPDMLEKVRRAAAWRAKHRARFLIEVDGGIAADTAPLARAAGADVFVAGNAIYGRKDPRAARDAIRRAVRG
ncbi:MAG TPA: ribulose-phosphate 3-epimerase [Candidatus Saccharimonadaceae bacterium]|jgi:ribulose-phosphate 3-epimerase|nr:ribulose-phosphate 3-epimerase [Candidatus Saccharimonadaceae bacterium]